MQDPPLSDTDLRLINALQIQPRGSWTTLARVLGSDPVTVARRWERLRAAGLAWTAVYVGGGTVALLEIECAPSDTLVVAEQLSRDPEVLTVDLTAGARDMVVTLRCADHPTLSRYVLERMTGRPMVRTVRTQVVAAVVSDARNWRLRALTADEVAALESEPAAPRGWGRPSAARAELEAATAAVLAREPRISLARLATRLGVSTARAGAVLGDAVASGRVVVRTEIARDWSEWPVNVWYFLRVTSRERTSTVARLAALRETRLVASMIGTYDVALAVWLRAFDDAAKLETYLADHFPQVVVLDRSVVLRTPYHLKRRLSSDGRCRIDTESRPD